MHALEKILAHHAGLKEVKAGEIVNCKVDIAGINDLYPQTMYSFWEIGGEKVANPENVVIFLDHYAPPLHHQSRTDACRVQTVCPRAGN